MEGEVKFVCWRGGVLTCQRASGGADQACQARQASGSGGNSTGTGVSLDSGVPGHSWIWRHDSTARTDRWCRGTTFRTACCCFTAMIMIDR